MEASDSHELRGGLEAGRWESSYRSGARRRWGSRRFHSSGLPAARSALVRGWIAEAEGDPEVAAEAFESVLGLLPGAPGAIEQPTAHLGLARALAPQDAGLAASGRLFISVKTAGNHMSSILTKLGLRSRAEAAAYAVISLPT